MKLPADCPYAAKPPTRRLVLAKIENREIACCRTGMHYHVARGGDPPLCRDPADEVYRFTYEHAFGAHAWVRISRRRDEVTVHRVYHPEMFSDGQTFDALLSEAEWRRLQDALIAANFWSLPPWVSPQGLWLDGYSVIVEGRRRDVYRATTLLNPDVDELRQLGRIAFDLAGLGDVWL